MTSSTLKIFRREKQERILKNTTTLTWIWRRKESLEKKRSELMNTGHIMSDETFITHLFNSLPQTVYKGAILVIKDKLRRSILEITEIEQILEDKFQAMKQAKGREEEEDDYALFVSPSNKKGPKKAFKGRCGYCGEFGHKAADCPNKSNNQTYIHLYTGFIIHNHICDRSLSGIQST